MQTSRLVGLEGWYFDRGRTYSQRGCSQKQAFSGIFFFFRVFLNCSHKLAPSAAGAAQWEPQRKQSHGTGTETPPRIYSLTCSATLGPLLVSSRELSSRGCW